MKNDIRPPDLGKKTVLLAFILILLFSFFVRSFSFFLQHWQGDQSQYVALAMKLKEQGLRGYNLTQMEIRRMIFTQYPDWQFMYPVLLKEGVEGDFFKAYERFGLEFNNMPLYYKSPLFPATLALSHRLFAPPNQPFVVVKTNMNETHKVYYDLFFVKTQFWAVIVPLLSNLLVIVLTFFFARKLFDSRTALLAMLLMSLHPIGIVTSYKVLADDFVSFFVIAALFLFYLANEKKSLSWALTAGVTAGFAFLAKQSAVLILPTAGLFLLLTGEKKWFDPRAWRAVLTNRTFLFFVFGSVFISAHWFVKIYQTYGNPFYQPSPFQMSEEDKTGWFGILSLRPHVLMLFVLNIPYLCPPFIFGHLTFKDFVRSVWKRTLKALPPAGEERSVLFLWAWVLPFLLFFVFRIESKEERYLLPVYPALAVLSAVGLLKFSRWLSARFNRATVNWSVAVLLLLTTAWSVPIAMETVFHERFLILQPAKDFLSFYRIIQR